MTNTTDAADTSLAFAETALNHLIKRLALVTVDLAQARSDLREGRPNGTLGLLVAVEPAMREADSLVTAAVAVLRNRH